MKAPHETKYIGGHLTHVPDLNTDNYHTLTEAIEGALNTWGGAMLTRREAPYRKTCQFFPN